MTLALKEIPAGARVMLGPGVYTETILIENDVQLFGPGLIGGGVATIEVRRWVSPFVGASPGILWDGAPS